MSGDECKTEPPLYLEMHFGEALARFTRTKPDEVKESVARAKQKKPPGDKPTRQRSKKEG